MDMRVSISRGLIFKSLTTQLDGNLFSARTDKIERKESFTKNLNFLVKTYF